jgi:hypothetical protein
MGASQHAGQIPAVLPAELDAGRGRRNVRFRFASEQPAFLNFGHNHPDVDSLLHLDGESHRADACAFAAEIARRFATS